MNVCVGCVPRAWVMNGMVLECPQYSMVRERHADLFECPGGVPGLEGRTIIPAQFRIFMLQEQCCCESIESLPYVGDRV
jgi:hypothetical protein